MSSIDRLLTGLVAFAGGMMAGVLLAPQSGAETRGKITDEARVQLKRMEGQLEGLEKKLADVTSQVIETSGEVSEKIRGATVDQVLPELPEDPEAFKIAADELAGDLRHMPKK
jgi:gas vesicle protein